MDTNKMRKQFEERKPVPAGIQWNFIEGRYVHSHIKMCATCKFHGYVELWEIWQASREAVVVELPAERRIRHAPMPDENGSYNEALENCRDAIEAQGLKVKP